MFTLTCKCGHHPAPQPFAPAAALRSSHRDRRASAHPAVRYQRRKPTWRWCWRNQPPYTAPPRRAPGWRGQDLRPVSTCYQHSTAERAQGQVCVCAAGFFWWPGNTAMKWQYYNCDSKDVSDARTGKRLACNEIVSKTKAAAQRTDLCGSRAAILVSGR